MATTLTFVKCPGVSCGGRCHGETVEARGIGDSRVKTVRIAACSVLREQGWIGAVQAAYTHQQASAALLTIR